MLVIIISVRLILENNFDYTRTPLDLPMPEMPQLVTTVIYGIGAVIFVAYALYLSKKHKSVLPICLVLGACLTIFLEPIVDLLGNAVHPQIGQFNVVTTNGHHVPWAVLIGYIWYFAGTPLLCYSKFVNQTLTQSYVWKLFAVIVLGAATVEQIPLYFGVWIYYGYQPWIIGYMPIWWIFANTAAVLVPFILVYKLFPDLRGWKQAMVIWILPMGAFMGHSAAGWPMYNVLGTETENFSRVMMYFSSGATVALSLFVVWLFMKICGINDSP